MRSLASPAACYSVTLGFGGTPTMTETPEETAARLAKEAADKAAADKAAADKAAAGNIGPAFLDEFAGLKKYVGYVHNPPGNAPPTTTTAPQHDPKKCLFGPFCPYGH